MNKLLIFLALGAIASSCSSSTTIANPPNSQPSAELAQNSGTDQQEKQFQELAQKLPPVSEITWQMCLTADCQSEPQKFHFWGEVKEVKLLEVKRGSSENVQAAALSQGCFESYSQPQPEAWYPLSGIAKKPEGKGEVKLLSNEVLDVKEKASLLRLQSLPVPRMSKPCAPLK